ncbi:MAG: hypothetical protein ACLFRD_04735 [Nitriliruptoraceae bacterium]
MAADRRTLIIAAVAMVALIAVGVASSALLTGSACDRLEPSPLELTADGTDLPTAVESAFSDVDEQRREEVESQLRALEGELGAISALVRAPGVSGLAATDLGVVATGASTVVVDAAASPTAIDTGNGAVVGDGSALYTLALENPLTGQVDALQPLATGTAEGEPLEGLTCQDTATVGTPLAFHLDAGGGELALLRVDEDGEEPVLELRDPVDGRVWASRLELAMAPAGVQGERLTGGLGPEEVITGYRSDPSDVEVPALSGFDRDDGEARWTLGRDQLGAALSDDRPDQLEVITVGEELALVAVQGREQDASVDPEATEPATEGPVTLVGIDPDDGQLRMVERLDVDQRISDAVVDGQRGWVAVSDDGRHELLVLGPEGVEARHTVEVDDARVARRDDGSVVVVGDQGVTSIREDGVDDLASPLAVLDVLATNGSVTLAVAGSGDQVLVVTYGG